MLWEEFVIFQGNVSFVEKIDIHKQIHVYPKLNGFRDNGEINFKQWELLYIYWLPNTYLNEEEFVVYVMLPPVLNCNNWMT